MPTVEELKQLCRDKGIKGYSGMNKEALIKHCGYGSPKRSPSITNRTSKVQISNKNKPTPKECEKWLQNKSVNPRNGRLVSKNGAIEKVLRENCKEKQQINPKRSSVLRTPPKPKRTVPHRSKKVIVPGQLVGALEPEILVGSYGPDHILTQQPRPKRRLPRSIQHKIGPIKMSGSNQVEHPFYIKNRPKQISSVKIDIISKMPSDMIDIIIQQLNLTELLDFAQTSQKNYKYVQKYTRNITDTENVLTNDMLILFPNLIYLNMRNSYNVSTNGIKNLTKLQYLYMGTNKNLTNTALKSLTNLIKLDVGYSSSPHVTDNGIKHLIKLKEISLRENRKISINTIKYLPLHSLHLSLNKTFKDEDIKLLTNLKNLSLDYSNITDNGIQNLTNLQVLHASKYITDNGINRLTNLEILYPQPYNKGSIKGTSFKHLNKLRILNADASMNEEHIKNLTNLEWLMLSCKNITGSSFKFLPKLKIISINSNLKILAKYIKILPNLKQIRIGLFLYPDVIEHIKNENDNTIINYKYLAKHKKIKETSENLIEYLDSI